MSQHICFNLDMYCMNSVSFRRKLLNFGFADQLIMPAILTESTTPLQTQVFYSSYVGFIFGFITIIMITIHVFIHYYLSFCKQRSEHNKTVYILVISFNIFAIIIGLMFCFIRSNFFTGIGPLQFTYNQCAIGYTVYYVSSYSCASILYITFIYRIQLAFKGSLYEYRSYIYGVVYILILINWLTSLVNILGRGIGYTSYIVIYTDIKGLAVCSSRDSLGMIAIIITNVMNIVIQGILLYMFSRGLWALNKQLLKMYMEKQFEINHGTSPSPSSNPSLVGKNSLKVVVDKFKSDGGESEDSVKEIIELYNLIKKQAICVCIAVFSTTFMGTVSLFESSFLFEIGWDGAINTISIWLMLSTSKKYWNFCKDYGLCKCCYLKTGSVK